VSAEGPCAGSVGRYHERPIKMGSYVVSTMHRLTFGDFTEVLDIRHCHTNRRMHWYILVVIGTSISSFVEILSPELDTGR